MTGLTGRKTTGGGIIGHLIANSENRDLETALNPAWRDTVAHVVVAGPLDAVASDEEIQAARDDVTYRRVPALKKLAPNSGAYFNEVGPFFFPVPSKPWLTLVQMDAFEPDWQRAAFGANYPRLRGIKDAYDPEGALWCRGCVGSESWVEDDEGRLCRADDEL